MKVATRNKRIIAALNNGASVAAVAAEYGVTGSNVYRIRSVYNRKNQQPLANFIELGNIHSVLDEPLVSYHANTSFSAPAPVTFTPPDVNTLQVGGDHYKQQDIQPWDAIHAWGLGYFSGNVVKYVARHQIKGGVQDLKKAQHYLTKLIELMEATK